MFLFSNLNAGRFIVLLACLAGTPTNAADRPDIVRCTTQYGRTFNLTIDLAPLHSIGPYEGTISVYDAADRILERANIEGLDLNTTQDDYVLTGDFDDEPFTLIVPRSFHYSDRNEPAEMTGFRTRYLDMEKIYLFGCMFNEGPEFPY